MQPPLPSLIPPRLAVAGELWGEREATGDFSGGLRISWAACVYNGACLLLQMEEKRRKYSISSDNSDTTDSKAFLLGLLQGKHVNNYQAQAHRWGAAACGLNVGEGISESRSLCS